MTYFSRSSNSPRYFVPATMPVRSSATSRRPARVSGTSSFTIRWAMPSTIAVLPTPGSPIRTGLFFVRRERISIVCSISSARPITGSSLPSRASSVRSRPYSSSVFVALRPSPGPRDRRRARPRREASCGKGRTAEGSRLPRCPRPGPATAGRVRGRCRRRRAPSPPRRRRGSPAWRPERARAPRRAAYPARPRPRSARRSTSDPPRPLEEVNDHLVPEGAVQQVVGVEVEASPIAAVWAARWSSSRVASLNRSVTSICSTPRRAGAPPVPPGPPHHRLLRRPNPRRSARRSRRTSPARRTPSRGRTHPRRSARCCSHRYRVSGG